MTLPKWTDERSEKAKALWKDGYSATEISRVLGVTRNSVISKIHRMGLTGADRKTRRTAKPRTETRSGKRLLTPPKVKQMRQLVEEMKAADAKPVVSDQVLALEPHHCRYPIGDPLKADFRFCCRDKIDGSSYCASHHEISRSHAPVRRGWTPTRRAA